MCVEGVGEGTRMILRPVPAVANALLQLAPPGEDEDGLADLVLAAGPQALAGWYYALQFVTGRGLVCRSVWASGRRLVTLLSASPSFTMAEATVAPARRYLLSRFAYLRREGDALVAGITAGPCQGRAPRFPSGRSGLGPGHPVDGTGTGHSGV